MTKAQPYVCPVCLTEEEGYYGRLVFPDELDPELPQPTCPYHKKVLLVPVSATLE